MKNIFEAIYDNNTWSLGSGFGSVQDDLWPYLEFLSHLIKEMRPDTVLDLGCGYFAPYQKVEWRNIHYLGIDVSQQCINANQPYAAERRRFICEDWLQLKDMPKADLVICKDVFQHWSHAEVCDGLLKLTGYQYCLITNSVRLGNRTINCDINTGDVRPLNLLIDPYCLNARDVLYYKVKVNPESDTKLSFTWEPKFYPFTCMK